MVCSPNAPDAVDVILAAVRERHVDHLQGGCIGMCRVPLMLVGQPQAGMQTVLESRHIKSQLEINFRSGTDFPGRKPRKRNPLLQTGSKVWLCRPVHSLSETISLIKTARGSNGLAKGTRVWPISAACPDTSRNTTEEVGCVGRETARAAPEVSFEWTRQVMHHPRGDAWPVSDQREIGRNNPVSTSTSQQNHCV